MILQTCGTFKGHFLVKQVFQKDKHAYDADIS